MEQKSVLPEEVQGWEKASGHESYNRQTIFDYIDGAGEVYLAYNMKDVDVFHYTASSKPEIVVEMYDMGSDKDAYGIFSYTGKNEQSGIGNGYDYLGSLLCFWQGQYFVNVTTTEETPETKAAMFDIARAISGKLPPGGEKPRLLQVLPQENLKNSSVLYFHKYSILNNEFYLSSDNILNLDSTTEAVLAAYAPYEAILLIIKYPAEDISHAAREEFISSYVPNLDSTGFGKDEKGNIVDLYSENKYICIVLKASSRIEAGAIMNKCRESISKLEEQEK